MPDKAMRPKVGTGVFVWRDGTFLMCKRIGAHGTSTWAPPGGHAEYGEALEEAAAREVLEETGMKIKNMRQIAVTNDIFKDHQKHYVTIWFRADWDKNEPRILEPDKMTELRWSTFQDLPSPLFEPCWQNLRQAKPELFAPIPEKPSLQRVMEFQQLLLDFRAIERKVAIPPGIDAFENDVEHSYSLAMTAWFLASYFPHLDRDTVIKMALGHDLLEVHAGDTFSYSDQKTLDEKEVLEAAAVERLRQEWPDFLEVTDVIRAYENRDSEEAKFVYALDKLMPALVDYLNEGRGWREVGITFEMFCKEKNKKVPISPEINRYCQELITILEKQQHLFPPEQVS